MDIKTYKKDFSYSYSLGAYPTIELLHKHPEKVEKVYIASSFTNQEVLDEIHHIVSVEKIEVNDKIINRLSSKDNVYVIGVFNKYLGRLDKKCNHLILVNPSNMGNLGTIIRSALGFGIKDIAIIRPGVDFFDPKVIRASMGAIFNINIEYFDTIEDYKKIYSVHTLYSFMLQAKTSLDEIQFSKSLSSLVFGNEATGLDNDYLDHNSIIIKHSNAIDSLNLPTAVGIALYEFNKQNK